MNTEHNGTKYRELSLIQSNTAKQARRIKKPSVKLDAQNGDREKDEDHGLSWEEVELQCDCN